MSSFAAMLSLRDLGDVSEPGLLIALDVASPQPSGELIRIDDHFLEGCAGRADLRQRGLRKLLPLVEGERR